MNAIDLHETAKKFVMKNIVEIFEKQELKLLQVGDILLPAILKSLVELSRKEHK